MRQNSHRHCSELGPQPDLEVITFADTAGHTGGSTVEAIRDASLGKGAKLLADFKHLILSTDQSLQVVDLCKSPFQPNAVTDLGKPSTACVEDGKCGQLEQDIRPRPVLNVPMEISHGYG